MRLGDSGISNPRTDIFGITNIVLYYMMIDSISVQSYDMLENMARKNTKTLYGKGISPSPYRNDV